ncbi:eCIS core domain-containing protein [Vibrio sp. FJH11]
MPEPKLMRSFANGGLCPKNRGEQLIQNGKRIQPKRIQAQRIQDSGIGKVTAPTIIHDVLRSAGEPLHPDVRAFFEPRLDQDLSGVRIHDNALAATSAKSINAKAYTAGNHIVFGSGQYRPTSVAGKTLLAHELTHVMQQTGGAKSNSTAHVPGIQREIQIQPPGSSSASAFDRAQELIDRMNGLSTGIEYRLEGGVLRYNVIDENALTPFDQRITGFIDRAEMVPMRLITGAGYVGGAPLLMDELRRGYVDLDDLMASDDLGFQSVMLHFLTERFNVRNYDRRLGMLNLDAEWDRVHPLGIRAEAEFLQDVFNDPSIYHNWVDENASRLISAFRSRDGHYQIFIIIRGGGRERRGAEISVRTQDGRRMSAEDFLAERNAAAPAAP